jgi:hypothetical protein
MRRLSPSRRPLPPKACRAIDGRSASSRPKWRGRRWQSSDNLKRRARWQSRCRAALGCGRGGPSLGTDVTCRGRCIRVPASPTPSRSWESRRIDRPGNPQFPFPPFPIWPGIGDSLPDSRFGKKNCQKSGIRESPIPDLAENRESGMLIPCEYQTRSGGQMSPLILKNADFRPPTGQVRSGLLLGRSLGP